MIELEKVTVKEGSQQLREITALFGAGVFGLLGSSDSGGSLLLSVLAGQTCIQRGEARILGAPPGHVSIQNKLAYIPLKVSVPDALRVDETLALAGALRKEPLVPAAVRLEKFGLAHLAHRPMRTLSPFEQRGVLLAEALTSTTVRVILLEEPYAGFDPYVSSQLRLALRACANAGACIVLATDSPQTASGLCDVHYLMRNGVLQASFTLGVPPFAATRTAVRLQVVTENIATLVNALANETALTGLTTQGNVLCLEGNNAVDLAAAFSRAVVQSQVAVYEARFLTSSLADLSVAPSLDTSMLAD